jgi:hypothetical protein
VNILTERSGGRDGKTAARIVPEIMPWNGSDEPAAQLTLDILQSIELRKRQREDLLKVVASLDRPGASMRTAEIAIAMMRENTKE